MSDENEQDPPHLVRYRTYKRRQELKRRKNKQTTEPPNSPPLSSPSLLESVVNHRITSPLLKLIIWSFLLLFFSHHEFGSVFFLASIPVLVWQSMEEYKRGPRELSAYSVFNDNLEQLDGTFTSEQWEKELRYGAAAVLKQE